MEVTFGMVLHHRIRDWSFYSNNFLAGKMQRERMAVYSSNMENPSNSSYSLTSRVIESDPWTLQKTAEQQVRHRLFKINSQQCAWKDLSKGLENGGGWNWYLSGETAVVIIPEGSKMDVKFGIVHIGRIISLNDLRQTPQSCSPEMPGHFWGIPRSEVAVPIFEFLLG